jgi:hypothetical protein
MHDRGVCRMLSSDMIFKTVTCAADSKPLLIKQFADSTDQQYFMVLVITAITAAFDRFELGKLLLPVT